MLYAEGSKDFFCPVVSPSMGLTKLTVHPRLQFLSAGLLSFLVYSGLAGVRRSECRRIVFGLDSVWFALLPGHESHPTVALSYLKRVYAGAAPDIDDRIAGTQRRILLISADSGGFGLDIRHVNERTNKGVRRGQFGQNHS